MRRIDDIKSGWTAEKQFAGSYSNQGVFVKGVGLQAVAPIVVGKTPPHGITRFLADGRDTTGGAYPNRSLPVFGDCKHIIVRKTVFCIESAKLAGRGVVKVEAISGGHPDTMVAVFDDLRDMVTAQRARCVI